MSGFYDQPGRDGRRKSDPLKSINGSPAHAPEWQLHRVVSAQDADFATRAKGCNCSQYGRVRFSVVPYDADPTIADAAAPGGNANPNIEIRVWSEGAGAFVAMDTPKTKAGAGAGLAYTVEVDNADGAILMIAQTNGVAGISAIYVQGFDLDTRSDG